MEKLGNIIIKTAYAIVIHLLLNRCYANNV